MQNSEHDRIFDEIVDQYPSSLKSIAIANKKRILWQVETVVKHATGGGTIVDLGGGTVPFMGVCQKLGYKTVVADDFGDATYADADRVLEIFHRIGVIVRNLNLLSDEFSIGDAESVAMVTCHDSMEHWHNSPKQLFANVWTALEANGSFWLGVPNAVNLRKRLTVPFGKGTWSHMDDWYEQSEFRGHVREPVVADLRYIAKDIGATDYEIFGRNWLGYRHPSKAIRAVIPYIDRPMQRRPAICSDIYLLAKKSAA